jgi:hypothetical protein
MTHVTQSAIAVLLTEDQARQLTDDAKAHGQALWTTLTRLYDGEAHKALGYEAWGDYYTAEFGESPRRGYQLVDAGRVAERVNNCSLPTPGSESVARELSASDDLENLWREAVERYGDRPTAKQVRELRTNGDGPEPQVEKVECPTCGHRVRPEDFKKGV